MSNDEISAREVAAFKADPPGPYFAYLAHDEITTWTGDKLARVISTGAVFKSGFGDKRQNFRARGINGQLYSGTAYVSAGDYVRMRPVAS